jgi:membrane-bound lytic murein transglycosylase D
VEQNFSFDQDTPSRKTGFLKSRAVRRVLWFTTISSAVSVVALSAAVHFGFLPESTDLETGAANEPGVVFAPPMIDQLLAPPGNLENASPAFDREQVLNDFENRIGDQFSIPENLRERVGFWFDVYTKYDEHRRIIHNSRHPWIIYKVVDVSSIILSDTPKRRWMRNQKADKFVDKEAEKIRAALKTVANKRDLSKLNEYERLVVDALKKLGPNVQKNARAAIGETRVQMGQKNFFEAGLEISPRYLGTMEKIFEKNKLPVELTRLPFVESSFNKHATSKVGAAGLWQFMGNTGRKFMIVNDAIDERRSPFKATEAAAKLLKENHMILSRSWPMAITAWNHGPGGIRKAEQKISAPSLSATAQKLLILLRQISTANS